MTQNGTDEQLTRILATIARRAETARKRAEQLEGHFQHRRDSEGFFAAIATVRASQLVDFAEDELYREFRELIDKSTKVKEVAQLTPAQTLDVVESFAQRIAPAVRREVEADSSSFMSNALAVARHNALVKVLEFFEECIEEAGKES